MEDGHVDVGPDHGPQQVPREAHQEHGAVNRHLRWHPDNKDGRQEGRQHAHGHRNQLGVPPGQQEVGAGGGLVPPGGKGEVDPDKEGHEEGQGEHQVVGPVELWVGGVVNSCHGACLKCI